LYCYILIVAIADCGMDTQQKKKSTSPEAATLCPNAVDDPTENICEEVISSPPLAILVTAGIKSIRQGKAKTKGESKERLV
jgi:hypothetical protein